MDKKTFPDEVFSPGEFIRDELEERGWTQNDLANIMGRPLRTVNEIIAAKKGITPETAIGLADAFGTSAELWLNLESAYRLSLVDNRTDEVARKARLYTYAPVTDMVKRRWIEGSSSIDELESRIAAYFDVPSLDERPALRFAARKSNAEIEATPGQLAWLYRAKHLALTQAARTFSKQRLDALLGQLRSLAKEAEEIRHVPKMLTDAGIRFVVVEFLPGARIDGAMFWLPQDKPVIALSLRFDRIDWFWHTLGHELGHIANEDEIGFDPNLSKEEEQQNIAEIEKRADEFGSGLVVPSEELDDFVSRTRPLFSKKKIIGFAGRIGVHPGIVVGQLQHRGLIPYSHSREMLVKVRSHLTGSALTDGWGNPIAI